MRGEGGGYILYWCGVCCIKDGQFSFISYLLIQNANIVTLNCVNKSHWFSNTITENWDTSKWGGERGERVGEGEGERERGLDRVRESRRNRERETQRGESERKRERQRSGEREREMGGGGVKKGLQREEDPREGRQDR